MPTTTSKKKFFGKGQGTPSRPPSTGGTPIVQLGDRTTPEETSQTRSSASREPGAEIRDQLNQQVANALGTPVQLSDSQFRVLLERLAATEPSRPIPSVEKPLISRPLRNTGGNDPDGSSSDSSSFDSNHRSRSHRRHRSRSHSKKLSPKHRDPDPLDNGASPTYIAWKSLLRGKLRANADWWPTEQDRIDYVFSCTTGEAQRHLEPRLDEDSLEPWLSVDEILAHLDTIFRNHFEAEEAENLFYALKQQATQDFNDFHTEFARLASVGRVPSSTWRSHLWRKLNREFQNRLLATHHQHPTYQGLVRECQRLSIDLQEFHRQFPPAPARQTRSNALPAPKLRQGLLPAPKAYRTSSPAPQRITPGPATGRNSTSSPARSPAPDRSQSTCFKCGEVGHFASSCPDSRATPRIQEIEQENASGDEAQDEADADESEN
jgi:hypothetical protein